MYEPLFDPNFEDHSVRYAQRFEQYGRKPSRLILSICGRVRAEVDEEAFSVDLRAASEIRDPESEWVWAQLRIPGALLHETIRCD
jgi:hypothetical protein